MDFEPTPELLTKVDQLACRAAAEIQHHCGKVKAEAKSDGSPVTLADQAAEAIILKGLAELTPDIPVVAEEAAEAGKIPKVGKGPFWLVDPLDGTKEFLRYDGKGEYTVNIGLIVDGQPVLGVVVAPAVDLVYGGLCGIGAYRRRNGSDNEPIVVRSAPADGLTVVSSRSHGDRAALERLLRTTRVNEQRHIGSSLKLCLIAAGEADLYPRLGPTMEWDIAAGQAILAAAGGRVETLDSMPMAYAKEGFLNPHFVAYGRCPSIEDRPIRQSEPDG